MFDPEPNAHGGLQLAESLGFNLAKPHDANLMTLMYGISPIQALN